MHLMIGPPRHAAAELGSGIMLLAGLGLAAITETAPSVDPNNLVTVIVAFLSAGGIGGLVARGIVSNWQKDQETERAREDEDRAADRAVQERLLTLMEQQNAYLRDELAKERSRIDQLVQRQYVATQTVEQQVVKS